MLAYRRQLSLGEHQAWPCPVGEWDGEMFVIHDGRHAYVAALAHGTEESVPVAEVLAAAQTLAVLALEHCGVA